MSCFGSLVTKRCKYNKFIEKFPKMVKKKSFYFP